MDEYKKSLNALLSAASEKITRCCIIPSFCCNCNCAFCISKTKDCQNMPKNLKYGKNMDESMELLAKRGIKQFEITGGGEPLMNENLGEIIKKIRLYIPDAFIKLCTNGQIMTQLQGVDEININIASDNFYVNRIIMGSLNDKSIQEKLKYWRNVADSSIAGKKGKLSLSIPIMNCGINNAEMLDRLINGTEQYVDEYVVRTLHSETPQYEKMFVNFEYDNPKVVWERSNMLCGSKVVMSTDGKLYEDFELKKPAYLKPYILLKPDSALKLREIMDMINDAGFKIEGIYLMRNFAENAIKLYYLKHPDYIKFVKKHLDLTEMMFGPFGIVLFLDKEGPIENVLYDTLQLKKRIRSAYALTHGYGGYISIDGGTYQLNMAHCPDPKMEYFDKDIEILKNMGMTKINEGMMDNIYRCGSYNIMGKE